ncbi:cytochrome P450 [Mycena leptocephala]|nr:cytochrome P450 [Mycena leptocephala]
MSKDANPVFLRELQREILEILAILHPESTPMLLLIARRGKIWIEPLLFHVLSIRGNSATDQTRLMRSSPSIRDRDSAAALGGAFFRAHVRHLPFQWDQWEQIIPILSVCDATTYFALDTWDTARPPSNFLPLLGSIHLRRLYVTHLTILDSPQAASWSGVALIPRLTHLAWPNRCVTTPRWLERAVPARAELGVDRRFVMVVVQNNQVDWETGARDGEDKSVRADEHVQRRRAGEVTWNMIQLVLAENYGDDEFGWHKQYGPVYRVKGCFGEDRLVVSDPQASKYILNNPAIIHSPNNAGLSPWCSAKRASLASMPPRLLGENHRRLRAAMNAGFSGNGVRNFLPVFVDVAKKMTSEWENVASAFIRSKANLIAEWFMAYMPDFVFRLALHLPIGPISAVHLFKHTTTKLMSPWRRFWRKSDVLSIIRAGSGFGKTGVIPSRLVHQLPVLLLAGQDTSAAALSGRSTGSQNPEFQDKLREEILNSQEGEL